MSKISLISTKKTSMKESAPTSKGKRKTQALRFELKLDLSSKKKDFNNFSFPELIKKQAKALKNKKSDEFDGDDPEVARLAAHFEEKYGGGICDTDGYIDKGEGYDENDSFIDNEEAYDELVPASLTTELGGFYINTGELNFKPVEPEPKDPKEAELEKANLLQKLKRKRKDEDEAEDIKPPRNKPGPKPKPKIPKVLNGAINLSTSGVSTSVATTTCQNVIDSMVVKLLSNDTKDPAEMAKLVSMANAAATAKPPEKKRGPKPGMKRLLSTEAKLEAQQQQQQQQQAAQRKQLKDQLKNQSNIDVNAFTQAMFQQMVAQQKMAMAVAANNNQLNLLANSGGSGQQQQIGSNQASTSNNLLANNNQELLEKLLQSKIPLPIIQAVPSSKPTNTDGKAGLTHEWNQFICNVFQKYQHLPKVRNRTFDIVSAYIGVSRDMLHDYVHRLLGLNPEAMGGGVASATTNEVRKRDDSASASSSSTPTSRFLATLSKASNNLASTNASMLANNVPAGNSLLRPPKKSTTPKPQTSNNSKPQNLVMKPSQSNSSGTSSNNNNPGSKIYSEGLAGKFMLPPSSVGGGQESKNRASPVTSTGATNLSTKQANLLANNKLSVSNPTQANFAQAMQNFAKQASSSSSSSSSNQPRVTTNPMSGTSILATPPSVNVPSSSAAASGGGGGGANSAAKADLIHSLLSLPGFGYNEILNRFQNVPSRSSSGGAGSSSSSGLTISLAPNSRQGQSILASSSSSAAAAASGISTPVVQKISQITAAAQQAAAANLQHSPGGGGGGGLNLSSSTPSPIYMPYSMSPTMAHVSSNNSLLHSSQLKGSATSPIRLVTDSITSVMPPTSTLGSPSMHKPYQ